MTALLMGAWGIVSLVALLMIEHRLARIQKALQSIAGDQPERLTRRRVGRAP